FDPLNDDLAFLAPESLALGLGSGLFLPVAWRPASAKLVPLSVEAECDSASGAVDARFDSLGNPSDMPLESVPRIVIWIGRRCGGRSADEPPEHRSHRD